MLEIFVNLILTEEQEFFSCRITRPYSKFNHYSESCRKQPLNKMDSYINRSLNKVSTQEIVVNLTSINGTPVYSEHKRWSQGGSV